MDLTLSTGALRAPALPALPALCCLACGPQIRLGAEPVAWTEVVTDSLEGAQVVDARGRAAFEAAHIPGSTSLPGTALVTSLVGLDSADVESMVAQLELAVGQAGIQRGEPLVIVGAGQAGWGDDGDLYWALRLLGHAEVRVYSGGISAWLAGGGVLEAGALDLAPSDYLAEPDASVLADTLEVASWGGRVVDVRSEVEWTEGHIPGAVHLEWTEVFADDAVLRPEEEVAELLAEHGIQLEGPEAEDTVVYCRRGVRAGHSFMVLDALRRSRGSELRLASYLGSWEQWVEDGQDIELP